MADAVSSETKVDKLSVNDFRKIYFHLCLAAKKQARLERSGKFPKLSERNILSQKIDELERRNQIKHDDWIKLKLTKSAEVKQTPDKNSEIQEIRNHILEVKKSYEALKLKKNVSKDKLKALKDRIERLESILRKDRYS